MKNLIFLIVIFQSCVSSSKMDELKIYKMRTNDNIPQLIELSKEAELLDKLQSIRLNNEVKVKVYPVYKVVIMKNGSITQSYMVSDHIVLKEGKSYRIKENIQELITSHLKEK